MPVNATNDKLGWVAPEFKLLDVSGKTLLLNDIRGSNGSVIAFICNHCPYVVAIAERLSKEAKELSKHSINTIAIMSNDVLQYPDDSYENMKIFATKYGMQRGTCSAIQTATISPQSEAHCRWQTAGLEAAYSPLCNR